MLKLEYGNGGRREMVDNIITEVGFILLGGAVAFIPIYILGLVLKGEESWLGGKDFFMVLILLRMRKKKGIHFLFKNSWK